MELIPKFLIFPMELKDKRHKGRNKKNIMKKSTIVILVILGFVLLFWISCRPKVSYCNTLPCCFCLATEEHLYLLLTFNKMEDQDHSLFVEP